MNHTGTYLAVVKPWASRIRNHLKSHRCSNPNLDMLLNRLEHVSPVGKSYRARCPVHQGKTRDSLKITPCDDGRILIHCFSQECPPLEILKVCGLELTDLFPERIAHHIAPVECRMQRLPEKLERQSEIYLHRERK